MTVFSYSFSNNRLNLALLLFHPMARIPSREATETPPSDPSAGTCFIWLRHDSTEPNEYFKYSSSAARLLYTLPTSHTDDPGLQFQNFQVETTSSQ